MNLLAEQIIIDIIKSELELGENAAWISNQNKKIPNDNGLYVVAGMVDSRVVSNVNTFVPTVDGMNEIQQLQMRENIQIDIFSRDTAALTRRHEVIAALNSFYAQQKQEEYNFRIFSIPPTFINSSSAEGGSNINRFSIIIACHTFFRKEKVIQSDDGDYFDEFSSRADDANTIDQEDGLFEFTITEE